MIRRLAALSALAVLVIGTGLGCGPTVHHVKVKVTYNGEPCGNAVVSFTEGSKMATGQTDASGMCELAMGNAKGGKLGVEPGNYAVTITKTEILNIGKDKSPEEAMKEYNKASKDNNPKQPGMMMPGGAGGPMTGKTKSLINEKYADAKTSGFTVNVPADTGSVKEFNLTGDKK